MASLTLKMVTPEKTALETEAEFVVLPALDGEMGVLPGHEPFMAQLDAGEIRIKGPGGERHFAVSGGFAEVLKNTVSVFVETAELAGEIDAERAAQAAERAKRDARAGAGDLSLAEAEAALKRAQVRLRVSKIRRPSKGAPSVLAPESDL